MRPVIVVSVTTMVAKRVLVVEGMPQARQILDRQLDELGLEHLIVNSAAEARRVVAQEIAFDTLLMNVQLPDGEGIATARALSHVRPGLRVAFLREASLDLFPGRTDLPAGAPCLRHPSPLPDLAAALAAAVIVHAE